MLSQDNPRLILVRISGYGQDGPYSHLPGYGAICEAIAGVRHMTGDPDRPPARVALATTDYLTAVYAAFGALLALEHRHRSGKGQVVDTALYETAFSMMESYVPAYPRLGVVREAQGPRLMNTAPNSLYRTRDDSYVLLAANNDAIFRRLAGVLGHPEWADDERYATQLARGSRVDELDAMVEAWTLQHDALEIVEAMNTDGVPVAKVYTIADIFADPHFAARGMLQKLPHPRLGEVVLPGIVPKLSDTPGEIREPGTWSAKTPTRCSRRPSASTRSGSPSCAGWGSWLMAADKFNELQARREAALAQGGPEGVAKQHARGKLTARERIDRLLDAGSFSEMAMLAGKGSYDEHGEYQSFTPSNAVIGTGESAAGASSSRPTTSPSAAARRNPRCRRSGSTPNATRTRCACRWCGWSTPQAAA